MSKLVVIKIGEGSLDQGYPVTLQIGDEDATPNVSLDGKLPPSAEIPLTYGTWKSYYWQKLSLSLPARVKKPLKQATNYSDTALIESSNLLEQQLNGWLNDGVFRPLKEKFLEKINPDNVVRVIIQTDDPILRRLPWHLWDLFASYRLAEVALYAPAFEGVKQSVQPKAKVRILAILGDASAPNPTTGITLDVDADKRFLESLPDAETVFLVEPSRREFHDKLWDEKGWDILFFAGHSSSEPDGTTGKMYINRQDGLTIPELKLALQKAIERGLQLAIFNSCDGLGIARDLAELHIPNVIVMREPVPDLVAKEFLKYFLTSLAGGKSLYLAVREARERLKGLETEISFPCASWLPVIYQNPAVKPTTWNQLIGISDLDAAVEFTTLSELKKISALSTKKEPRNIERVANIQNILPIPSRQKFQNRRALLSQVMAEVWGLLEQSVQNNVMINLHKENEQNSVKQSWDVEVKVGNKKNREIVKSSIIEIFDRESIAGRLLILGAPGAGKTTTLLELAQELIKRAENDANEPIPVLFNLSSWQDDNQTIFQFLIQELKTKYGVPQKVGQTLLQEQQLSLLLDGLDELASERQKKCVQAINQFMESEERPLYIVVCSRSEEYKLWKTPLKLNGAFYLSSLTKAQIKQYITKAKLSDLWDKINKFSLILELIETPLFLSMMTMAYKSLSVDEWGSYTTKETCREYLLKVYVEEMLAREIKNLWYPVNKEPKVEKVKYWLSWLANYLKFSPEFYIENLHPNWLENPRHRIIYLTLTSDNLWIRIYSLIVIFLLSLVIGFLLLLNLDISPFTAIAVWIMLTGGFCVYLDWKLCLMFIGLNSLLISFPNLLIFGLSNQGGQIILYFVLVLLDFVYFLSKLLLGLILHFKYNTYNNWFKECIGNNYLNDIDPIYILDSIKLSWDDAKKNFMGKIEVSEPLGGYLTLIIYIIVVSFVQILVYGGMQALWQVFSWVFYLLIGVAMLLGFIATLRGIFHGVREFELEEKKFPNQGIYYSLANTIRIIIFYSVTSGLFFSIFSWYFFGFILSSGTYNVFLDGCVGIIFGFIFSMVIGINGNKSKKYYPRTRGRCFESAKGVIQHFVLRLLLWFSGYIPWNYARFLNYATERMLLQRVGGRYRFIHRFLQEYFANMKLP